jgi:hypothetical protein
MQHEAQRQKWLVDLVMAVEAAYRGIVLDMTDELVRPQPQHTLIQSHFNPYVPKGKGKACSILPSSPLPIPHRPHNRDRQQVNNAVLFQDA